MADVKMTKKDWFMAIREQIETSDWEMADAALEWIDKQVESLNNRATKAAERAADKRAEGDALREIVASMVTDEWQTGEQITAAVVATGEDVTKAKVVARLSQLVKNHTVEKGSIKDDGRRIIAYRNYTGEAEEE